MWADVDLLWLQYEELINNKIRNTTFYFALRCYVDKQILQKLKLCLFVANMVKNNHIYDLLFFFVIAINNYEEKYYTSKNYVVKKQKFRIFIANTKKNNNF